MTTLGESELFIKKKIMVNSAKHKFFPAHKC